LIISGSHSPYRIFPAASGRLRQGWLASLVLVLWTVSAAPDAVARDVNPVLQDHGAVFELAIDLDAPLATRTAAREFLVAAGPASEAFLTEQLAAGNPLRRQIAAELLGQCGTEAAEPPMRRALADENVLVRTHAVRGFASWVRRHWTPGRIAAALRVWIDRPDPRPGEGRALLRALAQTDGEGASPGAAAAETVAEVAARTPPLRPLAAVVLGHASGAAAPAAVALLKAWTAEDMPQKLRLASLYALGRIGTEAEILQGALTDPAAIVRVEAAGALVRMGRTEALGALLAPLKRSGAEQSDPDAQRSKAAALLGSGADGGARLPFGGAVAPERLRALNLLRELAPMAAAPVLHERLADPSWRVRKLAAEALGAIGASAVDTELREALRDPVPAVRTAAAEALHRRGARALHWRFIEALGDGDAAVRVEAARTLALIGDAAAVEPLGRALGDRSVRVAVAAAGALGDLAEHPGAVRGLLGALSQTRPAVALRAANELQGATGLPFARDPAGALAQWHSSH
jgi:HEAT repeat protein